MAENPTTGELYKAKALTEDNIAATVDAFMADSATSAFLFGNGLEEGSPQSALRRREQPGP